MPREFARSERVAQLINRHLATILREQVNDPRVSALTVTDVEVSKDLRHAKVFLTSLLDEATDIEQTMRAVERASGFLRRSLAAMLELRHCPSLVFVYDDSISQGARMSALIDRALKPD